MKPAALSAFCIAFSLFGAAAVFGQTRPAAAVEQPAEIRVEGSRPAPPVKMDELDVFDASFVTSTDAFTADEVLSKITASLPGTQQVVLINGRESLVDLATIPAEMIDHIEVSTSGVRPDGRPRATGNVINVILKERYNGANLALRQRDSFAGGGGLSQLNASGGYTLGDLSGRFNVTHREQDALRASERDFSRDQDHTEEGGADYRLPYGTPAVVQAVAGSLSGITDSNGAPVSVALVPGALSTGGVLTPADFIPAPEGTQSAAGLRRFNTSPFLYLAAPSESNSADAELTYKVTPDLKFRAGYNGSRSNSHQSGPPPVSAATSASVVPAAYNPFDQDVEVGLVHSAFGAVKRESSQHRDSGFVSGEGRFAETWAWNSQFDVSHRTAQSETHDLDATKFAAALQAADPAQRFDPFADTGPGSANAALYPALTTIRRSTGVSDDQRFRFDVQGEISKGWVAPIRLQVGMGASSNDSHQTFESDDLTTPDTDSRNRLRSLRTTANLYIPVFKVRDLEYPATWSVGVYSTRDRQRLVQQPATSDIARAQRVDIDTISLNNQLSVPWVQPADGWRGVNQLETQIGVGVVRGGSESDATENVGVLWSPLKPLTLRADYARMQTPIPTQLYQLTVDYNQTLIDRLRADPLAEDVRVVSSQPNARRPPLGTRMSLALEFVPPSLQRLKLSLSYMDTQQQGRQRSFAAQDVLDNEAALPGRVIRLPPTPEDIANGQPGEVVQVDITPFSGGSTASRSVGLTGQYSATGPRLGLLTLRGNAQYLLENSNELIAGTQVISTNDQESPPTSALNFQTEWQRKQWSAAALFSRTGSGTYAGTAYSAFATLDMRLAYQFDKPFGGRAARSVRVSASIQNVFDADPPFADTITGFRGGSALGRTYELSVRAPFGG